MAEREGPTVSVVIPAYNAAPLLRDTIESVLAQTYPHVEVIVVDDGSTDETPEILEDFGGKIHSIRQENAGSAAARNRGIRAASGEYIALLDADDRWMPEKLELQMEQLTARSDLVWNYTDWLLVDGESETPIYRASQVFDHPRGHVLRPLIGRLFIPPSTEVIHREVFDEVGLYDESDLHRISEDWEFTLRVAERYPVGYVDRPLVGRPRHPDKKTSTMNLEHALQSRRAIIEKAIQRNPRQLGDLRDPALANLYTKIGRKWLEREERQKARAMFWTALQHVPTDWRAWMYGIATFLPRPLLRVLGRIRRLMWKIESQLNRSG